MINNKDLIAREFAGVGIELTEEQKDQFAIYLSELMEYNTKVNLTSHVLPEDNIRKNFIDSLSCLNTGNGFNGKKVIDLGTGAGFPGIPLKLMVPEQQLYLLESTGKKVDFLKLIIEKLNLKSTYCYWGRTEDFARLPEFREQFDIVLARALASLPVLLEYAIPFLKVNGIFLAQKGKKYKEEIELSSKALKVLGGEIIDVKDINFYNEDKKIIIIKKISKTPGKYPRNAGTPAKKPL